MASSFGKVERFQNILRTTLHWSAHELQAQWLGLPDHLIQDHNCSRIVSPIQRSHSCDFGKDLVQQLYSFGPKSVRHEAQTGEVTAGPG